MSREKPTVLQADDQFKTLLRELFQFAKADLNFGIYRVMNQKREQMNEFIDKKIVAAVDDYLQKPDAGGTNIGSKDQEAAREFIKNNLGVAAFDSKNRLLPTFWETPAGKVWLVLEKALGESAPPASALRNEAFNRLYDFFSRYYDDGDFMCRQRYSASGRYAIPYNGEEVLLHWANRDQYYIKTAEFFPRYEFMAGSITVRFTMRNPDLEKDNNKSAEKKYFIPLVEELEAPKNKNRAYLLPFEYRPLNGNESLHYTGNGIQDKIVEAAVEQLSTQTPAIPLLKKQENDIPLIKKLVKKLIKELIRKKVMKRSALLY